MIVTETPNRALKLRELRAFLKQAALAVPLEGDVSVLLGSDERIRVLNRDFRGKDTATDVLSFPAEMEFPGAKQAGDLAISLETAGKQAEEHGHPLQVEVKILMLHGLLHLAGYDHEADKGQMARKENALRKELGLPMGLIARSGKTSRAVPVVKKRAAPEKSGGRAR